MCRGSVSVSKRHYPLPDEPGRPREQCGVIGVYGVEKAMDKHSFERRQGR